MHLDKAAASELYDRDYYAWVQDQVDALRQHRVEDVDWENVAEEIEDLGKSQRRSIESQMVRMLEHLLKLQHASDPIRRNNARGWQLSVKDARLVMRKLLDENPSLHPELAGMLPYAYQRGRLAALRKAKLPDQAIPESCPWAVEQVMDDNFVPAQAAG
jgi:hypothetical protein